jgi:hypothetical protein
LPGSSATSRKERPWRHVGEFIGHRTAPGGGSSIASPLDDVAAQSDFANEMRIVTAEGCLADVVQLGSAFTLIFCRSFGGDRSAGGGLSSCRPEDRANATIAQLRDFARAEASRDYRVPGGRRAFGAGFTGLSSGLSSRRRRSVSNVQGFVRFAACRCGYSRLA